MNGKHGRLFLITIITAVILCGCTGKKAVNEVSTASQDPESEQTADSTQAPGREQAADPSHASGTVQGTGSEQAPLDAEFNIVYKPAEPLEKYRELLQINPYVAGWLKIDDTVIDVPVVYTPGSQNYFLHRAIDGSESSSGTLFIAINWQEGFNNTLIYGHNMKDGTAFGSLSKFKKESYGRSHHTIHFDTLYEEREYELYGVFYSQIDEDELETEEDRAEADAQINEAAIEEKAEEGQIVEPEELTLNDIDLWEDFGDLDIWRPEKDNDRGRFRYYYYNDLSDRDDWEYFARNVKERSVYDMGIDAEWGDEFVTLSTCSYHVHNGRFVVVGIRKAK